MGSGFGVGDRGRDRGTRRGRGGIAKELGVCVEGGDGGCMDVGEVWAEGGERSIGMGGVGGGRGAEVRCVSCRVVICGRSMSCG